MLEGARGSGRLLICLWLGVPGCGGTAHAPRADAGASLFEEDGGGHGSPRDAEAVQDSGRDATVNPGGLDCDLGTGHFQAEVSADDGTPFAMAVSVNTARLLYTVPACVDGNGLPHGSDLRLLDLPSAGLSPEPVTLQGQAASCTTFRDPALFESESGRALGYYARADLSGDAFLATDLSSGAASPPQPLATLTGLDSVATAAGVVGTTGMVAWVARPQGRSASELVVFRNASRTSRRVLVDASLGRQIAAVGMGGLGAGTRGGPLAVVGWVEQTSGARAIRLQLLDESASTVGSAVVLDDRVGFASNIDVAAHDAGGAVVYTIGTGGTRHEVRLQVLNQNGAFVGLPVSVTSGDEDVRGAAIARFATGYAVAYRSLPADLGSPARLKIAFFDSSGNLGGVRLVTEVARNAGPIQMELARDGRLFIAWLDAPTGKSPTLRAVRALCH